MFLKVVLILVSVSLILANPSNPKHHARPRRLQKKSAKVEQQAQGSELQVIEDHNGGHGGGVSAEGGYGEHAGSYESEDGKNGAELISLAHNSAVQAKNAVQIQHTAGSQAAFGIKSTLASAASGAAQTAQAAVVGKQALVNNLKRQLGQAEHQLQEEVALYHQAQDAAHLAEEAAQQVQSQIAILSGLLASAQSGASLANKAAASASNVAAAQQAMVVQAKQRLNTLIHKLQSAIHELQETEGAAHKAAESALIAQNNAAAAGAAVVAASAASNGVGKEEYGHH